MDPLNDPLGFIGGALGALAGAWLLWSFFKAGWDLADERREQDEAYIAETGEQCPGRGASRAAWSHWSETNSGPLGGGRSN